MRLLRNVMLNGTKSYDPYGWGEESQEKEKDTKILCFAQNDKSSQNDTSRR